MGDMNLHYMQTTVATKELKSIQNETNLRQLIKSPTRITQKTETLIDHIYTNYADKYISEAGVLHNNVSDHLTTYLLIKKEKKYHHQI